MADPRNPRRLLYVLIALLAVIAAAVMFVKVRFFGFSLSDRGAFFYQVDGIVSLEPAGDVPLRISLAVPEPAAGWAFVPDPDFRNGFHVKQEGRFPRLVRTFFPPVTIRQVPFRYRLVPAPRRELPDIEPPAMPDEARIADSVKRAAEQILARIDPARNKPVSELIPPLLRELAALPPPEKRALASGKGADMTIEAAIAVLEVRGIPARAVRGILFDQRRYRQQPSVYLDVWHDGQWRIYRPGTGTPEPPDSFLVLQRNDHSLLEVSGARNTSILFSITRVPAGVEQLNRIRDSIIDDHGLSEFSLFSLPAAEQNLFKRLALLPLAILLIVIARNIIGISTMGTFMPVLIAMAFLEMQLLPGLVNFALILTVGLGIRAWLSKLNLLMVPRISAVVVVVILLMQLISVGANLINLPEMVHATYFPIIIIAWTIERASTTWEEDGARNTLKQLGASLGAAVVCYLVLSNAYLQYLLYTFAELNLIILGVILLLGTYTGYRLTELARFEPLVKP